MFLARRVEPVGRFVQDQQAGPGEQGGGQAETLTHAEGESLHPVVGQIGEPDLVQGLVNAQSPGLGAAQRQQRRQVLPGGQRRVQTGPSTNPATPSGTSSARCIGPAG